MSVADRARAAKERRRRSDRFITPGHWKLWRVPRPFLVLVLAVDTVAVAAIALTAGLYPVTTGDLARFAVLAGLSAAHLEANRRVERMRELASEGVPYVNLKSIWTFAGLLLLPPPLVAALIAISYAHSWVRMGRAILPHRWTFSASTVVLASAAGGVILAAAYPLSYPTFSLGWSGVAVVVAVAIARWAVNSALVFVAMPLMSPTTSWRQAWRAVFRTPEDDLTEFAALGLGALVAAALALDAPVLLAALAPLVMAVHRSIHLSQFAHAAQRDRETGALRLEPWLELAGKQLERAERLEAGVGYLFVRLDEVDARLAEVPDGRIGRLVADTIRSEVREGDLVGRLPGGVDFAVLLAGIADNSDLARIADRIRRAVKSIKVSVDTPVGPSRAAGLTVSIGGAGYPSPAGTLAELMQHADNAMFLAKSFVRDVVFIVGPDTPATAS